MGKSKLAVILAVVIVVVVAGAWVLGRDKANAPTAPTQSEQNSSSSDTTAAATITYTGSEFSPAEITVKAGDTVKMTNSSSVPLQLDSDPHPTHTDDPDLNVGTINPGESQTFTVNKAGTWGYHNHLNPAMTGKINVE